MGCDSIFIVSVCLCVSLFNSLHNPYMASHDVLDGSILVDEEPCAIPGTDIHSGAWWWPASPECVCGTIFEMQTTVPVLSMSLVGLPSPSWTHPWRKWLPFPGSGWREDDLAGLLEMPTRPPPVEPTEELWSCRTSSRSSGIMLWWPTTGLVRGATFHDVQVVP